MAGHEAPERPLGSAARAVSGRELHRGRARAARAALHRPRRPRLRAHQPARDGQGRAVRALLALPRHAAAAVPRRVRRLAARGDARLRRRARASARPSSTSASSSATATTPSPSSAARTSRASGPRNILTKILQRPRLGAYLEQSTRYIAYDAPMPGGGYRYYRDAELGPQYEAAMDSLFDAYARGAADRARVGRRDVPARRRRAGRRAPPRGQRQGLRPAARPAARRLALAHGHLRDRPGLRAADPAPARPPAARGALLRRRDPRRDQGRDAELRRARRAARARRRVGALPRAPARGGRALGRAARARPRRGRRGPARRCGCCTSTATRTGCSPRCCSRPPGRARSARARRSRAWRRRRARAAARRPGRRAREPPPPPRPRLRGAALPLRGRLGLRRVPRPPAPPHAHDPVAGPHARPRRRRARRGRRGRRRRPLRPRARALARRSTSGSPRPACATPRPTRSASASASATCST